MKTICVKLAICILTFFLILYGSGYAAAEDLSAPEGLKAVNVTYTSISLCWTYPNNTKKNIKGYQLYRDGKKIITVSKTSYTNNELIPGREYVYAVKAYDSQGNVSGSSTVLRVSTVEDKQVPLAPAALIATDIGYTTVNLSWKPSTDNVGIKKYDLYCNDTKKVSTSATSYTCKGLTPGRTYLFSVKACDSAGNNSCSSNMVNACTSVDLAPPSIPAGVKSSFISETEITINWIPSLDNVKVKGYEIYCDGSKIRSTSSTSCKVTGLLPGKAYTFAVRAKDSSENYSGYSNDCTVSTLKDTILPEAPAGLKVVSISGTSVSLEWNASRDNVKVKGYNIYCNGMKVASTTRTSLKVKIPKSLGFGIYTVKAYDLAENISKASNTVTAIAN